MLILEFLKTVFLGIVEGVTEWLPISSTGHMILVDEFIKLDVSGDFMDLFLVVVQIGAIAAVPVLFWNRLYPFSRKQTSEQRKSILILWTKVIVGVLPAAVIGLIIDDYLDKYLYNYVVVAIALIVYGILFVIVEKNVAERLINRFRKKPREISERVVRVETVETLSYYDALKMGLFQVLSFIPGTSRSGSTILGGMMIGVSRTASAEFSFFMAIPIMLGASGLKLLKFILEGLVATWQEVFLLLVGIVVSFFVSLFIIKFLMEFVKRHDFSVFGVYRIVLGTIVLFYFFFK